MGKEALTKPTTCLVDKNPSNLLSKERLAEIDKCVTRLKTIYPAQTLVELVELLSHVKAQDELIEKLGGAVDGWMNRDRTQVNKDFDGVDKILKSLEAYRAWRDRK